MHVSLFCARGVDALRVLCGWPPMVNALRTRAHTSTRTIYTRITYAARRPHQLHLMPHQRHHKLHQLHRRPHQLYHSNQSQQETPGPTVWNAIWPCMRGKSTHKSRDLRPSRSRCGYKRGSSSTTCTAVTQPGEIAPWTPQQTAGALPPSFRSWNKAYLNSHANH